jgi:eukaryotic-like serine/threonine-protein kinase
VTTDIVLAMHGVAGAGRVVGGRYRLRDPIGRGAMGTVWRGRDDLLDRGVAVKEVEVPPALSPADRRSLYQRTLREAKTAARLNHPGVVTVFDVVEEDGRPWIVMELVQARSLERILAEDGPLPVPDAAGIGRQLVSALTTAHAAGVLHRDVKPSNVLLAPDGRAVLTDFGIATFEGDERLTQTGMVLGTPEFTPPERIRGEPASPSSDLWSLGATLYAAVQGRGPYAARGGPFTTMNAVLHEDTPAAPSAGRLGPVISALMHKDPAARPDAARASALLAAAAATRPPYTPAGPAQARAAGPPVVPTAFPGPAPPSGAPSPWPAASSWSEPGGPSWSEPGGPSWSGPDGPARPGSSGGSWSGPGAPPWSGSGGQSPRLDAPPSWSAPPSSWPDPPSSGNQPATSMYGAPVADAPPGQDTPLGGAPPYSPRTVTDLPSGDPPVPGPDAARPGRRSRRAALVACAALVIVAAGVLGGLAAGHGRHGAPSRAGGRRDASHATTPGRATRPGRATGPGTASPDGTTASPLPQGYVWYSRPAASAGTAAGFRLAVPQGWAASTTGLTTYLRAPAGAAYMEIDLTRHTLPDPMAEARWLEARTLRQGKFPGYRRVAIRPVRVPGSTGAVWSFTWQKAGVGRVFAVDYLFDLATGGGPQSYAVYASGPATAWRQTTQILGEGIRTFRPLP